MQFGMPTLIELKSLEENAALCCELGLSFVELNMNLPQYQAENLDNARLRKTANQYGIFYTIHIDENLSPCDFNDRIASAYTQTVVQSIHIAKQLSIPVLNMHLSAGIYFTLPDTKVFLFEEYKQEYTQKLTDFRDACEAAIGNEDIKICIENTSGYNRALFLQESLDILLESSVFALTFDIGHNAGTGFVDEDIILARSDRLYHMHIHDAIASQKRYHLTLGTGELDLPRYLKIAKQHNCRCVFETKTATGLRQSVAWLKERGRTIIAT